MRVAVEALIASPDLFGCFNFDSTIAACPATGLFVLDSFIWHTVAYEHHITGGTIMVLRSRIHGNGREADGIVALLEFQFRSALAQKRLTRFQCWELHGF